MPDEKHLKVRTASNELAVRRFAQWLKTSREREIVRKYWAWMQALAQGRLVARTPAQRHFVAVTSGKSASATEFEHLFIRLQAKEAKQGEARRRASEQEWNRLQQESADRAKLLKSRRLQTQNRIDRANRNSDGCSRQRPPVKNPQFISEPWGTRSDHKRMRGRQYADLMRRGRR